jgi:hypothetical protein
MARSNHITRFTAAKCERRAERLSFGFLSRIGTMRLVFEFEQADRDEPSADRGPNGFSAGRKVRLRPAPCVDRFEINHGESGC